MIKHWRPIVFYAVVMLMIMAPLLGSGYILTVDMVIVPVIHFPEQVTASYPLHALLSLISHIIQSDMVQKLLLCTTLFFAGIGVHGLTRTLLSKDSISIAPYFAGLMYILNPFVYSRFMAGQYSVLLGYALLPLFLRAWIMFLREPGWRKAVAAAAWLVAISIVSIHTLGLALLAAAIFGAVHWWQHRRDTAWHKAAAKHIALAALITLLANLYWLLPAMLGQGRTVSAIAGFGSADLAAFATSPDGFGWLGNVLSLQGFWADSKNLYIIPMDVFNWWWIPWLALWALIIFGIYKSWRAQRGITTAFLALTVTAAILAIGTAGTLAKPINEFLIAYIPFFAGYREPQKFVALIALAYAYFGAVGVAALTQLAQEKINHKLAPAVVLPLFVLPFLIAPLMLWGFNGQLQPRHYPADWHETNYYLQHNDPQAKVLFLPWHMYMPFDFAGRTIANPADKFFANPVIISNDPEMAGAKSYSSSPDQQELQSRILPSAKAGAQDFAKNLRMLNIRYVLLAKELDYKGYGYLDTQPGLVLVRETPAIKLYKVTPVE